LREHSRSGSRVGVGIGLDVGLSLNDWLSGSKNWGKRQDAKAKSV
jgi:hypothetical protein